MVSSSDGDYIESKRVSFRRLIDGVRVIGNDICDLYFDSNGLYDIEIKFYDYEKTGELDMLTLDEAVAKIKEPDAFVLESATNRNFSGAADKLTVERTKLLFVNRYSDGCEILQPVYNLMGTAENTGRVWKRRSGLKHQDQAAKSRVCKPKKRTPTRGTQPRSSLLPKDKAK